VEEALKRSKSNSVSFDPDTDVDLRQLITPPNLLRRDERPRIAAPDDTRSTSERLIPRQQSSEQFAVSDQRESRPLLGDSTSPDQLEKADELALDNADNPLQLLAMASALPSQPQSSITSLSPGVTATQIGSHATETEDAELQRFFGSLMPNLDNSQDLDPIELGLVTKDEAESLFK
jgi:hypothetical protein